MDVGLTDLAKHFFRLLDETPIQGKVEADTTISDVDKDNFSPGRPDFGELDPHSVDAPKRETLWQERENTRCLERQRRTSDGSRALQARDSVRDSSKEVGGGASKSLGLVEALLLAEGVDLVSKGALQLDEEMLAPPPEFADEATASNPRAVEKELKGAPSRVVLAKIPKRRDLGTNGHRATVPSIEELGSRQAQRELEACWGRGSVRWLR
ncbi:hypothetical protein QAD02_013997 [Eretmocerus hayati]|uniref:Uncharacterized protein n=1 Tax=Eretmocerus hayati TaxID=131215 RepID=A0ACC2P8V6_9HYME|nr:hypothetical protein QAD02_013997 [Eretmocerus hayati]